MPAVVLAQHPTNGERWQLTRCLEGERTAWPAMCDASPLCVRLVGRIRATASRRTGSAPRVFVTEPPQLDGRSQVGRSRAP